MELEDYVVSRAKYLYVENYGNGVEDMKKYVKQAMKDFHFEENLRSIYTIYGITYEDYAEQLAKDIVELMVFDGEWCKYNKEYKKLKGDIQ